MVIPVYRQLLAPANLYRSISPGPKAPHCPQVKVSKMLGWRPVEGRDVLFHPLTLDSDKVSPGAAPPRKTFLGAFPIQFEHCGQSRDIVPSGQSNDSESISPFAKSAAMETDRFQSAAWPTNIGARIIHASREQFVSCGIVTNENTCRQRPLSRVTPGYTPAFRPRICTLDIETESDRTTALAA